MKHPASQSLFRAWDAARATARAPTRQSFDPESVRALLGDCFVLAYGDRHGSRFRMAGTRLCALFRRDIKNTAFAAVCAPASQQEFEDLVAMSVRELVPIVAGVDGHLADGAAAPFELLLLPFRSISGQTPTLTGLLAPLVPTRPAGHGPLQHLRLSGWRRLDLPAAPRFGRLLRRWVWGPGLTWYEADSRRAENPYNPAMPTKS
jgi:hypothetical protein